MTDIDRINAMGLRPGYTIQMRHQFTSGPWVECRRTLLWRGEQVAVWASSNRNGCQPVWSEPRETATPINLVSYGEWRKVEAA